MVPTRRGLLGVVGLLAVGAGCGGIDTDASTETGTVAAGGEPPGGAGAGRLTDPATVVVRGDPGDDRPPVVVPESGRLSEFQRDGRMVESEVIADGETAASVETTAAADDETVRSFLADTEFADESVYLQTLRVSACYEVELCSISWTAGEVETDYGRRLKPYTEPCPADTRVFETRLVRVPGRIGDANAFSTSLGGGSCRPPERRERDDTDGERADDNETATHGRPATTTETTHGRPATATETTHDRPATATATEITHDRTTTEGA